MLIGNLQIVFSSTDCELPIQAQTTCRRYSSASSVSRVLRRFWNGLSHGFRPAYRMIRLSWVRRFELLPR